MLFTTLTCYTQLGSAICSANNSFDRFKNFDSRSVCPSYTWWIYWYVTFLGRLSIQNIYQFGLSLVFLSGQSQTTGTWYRYTGDADFAVLYKLKRHQVLPKPHATIGRWLSPFL